MKIGHRNRVLLAMLCAIGVSGCASVQIGRAQTLAAAGATAATSLANAQAAAASSFAEDRETEGLQDAILGAPPSPESPEGAKVAAQLAARQNVAAHLKDAYAAFLALARYDAAGEFKTSANGLFDAVNAAASLSGTATTVEQALSVVGGGILGLDQSRKLKAASAVLRRALSRYQQVLTNDGPALNAIQASAVRAHYLAVNLLWQSGKLSSEGLMADLVPEAGLSLVGGEGTYTKADPQTSAIVSFELQTRERSQLASIPVAQRKEQALVASLIRQHLAFEHGAPLTLTELASAGDELASSMGTIADKQQGTGK